MGEVFLRNMTVQLENGMKSRTIVTLNIDLWRDSSRKGSKFFWNLLCNPYMSSNLLLAQFLPFSNPFSFLNLDLQKSNQLTNHGSLEPEGDNRRPSIIALYISILIMQ